jgi:hypothetical protein
MITIGFFSNDNLLANVIKWFEGSPVNHCAIGFVKNGEQCWLQAAHAGIQVVDRGWLSGLVAEFEIIPNIENEVELAEKRVGEPYDDLTLVGMAIIIIAKLFGIGFNNPFYQKAGAICSELIIEADIDHLISEFNGLDPANISPALLYQICLQGKSFKRIS